MTHVYVTDKVYQMWPYLETVVVGLFVFRFETNTAIVQNLFLVLIVCKSGEIRRYNNEICTGNLIIIVINWNFKLSNLFATGRVITAVIISSCVRNKMLNIYRNCCC